MKLFNRHIKYYALTNNYTNLDNIIIYTLTTSVKECEEYLNHYLIAKHKNHFLSWCKLHNKDDQEENSWYDYQDTVLNEDELSQFHIEEFKYSKDDLVVFLRMLNGCIPCGCSFEREAEVQYFYDNLDEESKKKLESIKHNESQLN